jgi:hypothetical protein
MDNLLLPLAFCHIEYERIQQMCLWQRQQLANQRDYLAQQTRCEDQQIACAILQGVIACKSRSNE